MLLLWFLAQTAAYRLRLTDRTGGWACLSCWRT